MVGMVHDTRFLGACLDILLHMGSTLRLVLGTFRVENGLCCRTAVVSQPVRQRRHRLLRGHGVSRVVRVHQLLVGQPVVHPERLPGKAPLLHLHVLDVVPRQRHAILLCVAPHRARDAATPARGLGTGRGSRTLFAADATQLSTESAAQNTKDANAMDVSELVWDKPYCRFAPYLIGIFSAYVYKYHSVVVRGASQALVAVGWGVCALVLGFLIFFATGPARVLDAQPTRMGAALLVATARPLFALCLSWLCLVAWVCPLMQLVPCLVTGFW